VPLDLLLHFDCKKSSKAAEDLAEGLSDEGYSAEVFVPLHHVHFHVIAEDRAIVTLRHLSDLRAKFSDVSSECSYTGWEAHEPDTAAS
jgi:hypothetical protein